MFTDTGIAVGTAAKNKVQFLRENPPGYFTASLLAGFYAGLGILLIFTKKKFPWLIHLASGAKEQGA